MEQIIYLRLLHNWKQRDLSQNNYVKEALLFGFLSRKLRERLVSIVGIVRKKESLLPL